MIKAKEYENQADRSLEAGKLEVGLVQLNLAAKQYEVEKKPEKARECATLYKLMSGTFRTAGATNRVDMEQGLSELKQARRLLKRMKDPKAKDLLLFTQGLILETRGMIGIWNGKLCESIHVEEAGKQFLLVKDRVPALAELAEVMRLEAISEASFMRALQSLQDKDQASYTMNLGESQVALQNLIRLVEDQEFKTFYSGVTSLREAQIAFIQAHRHLDDCDLQTATTSLRKSSELASKAAQQLSRCASLPKAQVLKQTALGHQDAVKALASSLDGLRNLSLGNPQLARRAFTRCVTESEIALQQLATSGQFGRGLVALVIVLQASAKSQVKIISAVLRHSRKRLTLSAGTQFALAFLATLCAFVVLQASRLLEVASALAVYVSLVVAAITAFGLNALRLKDLLLPARMDKHVSTSD